MELLNINRYLFENSKEKKETIEGIILLIMLTNSFILNQGIGPIIEKRLWESGIRNWVSFFSGISHSLFPPAEDIS